MSRTKTSPALLTPESQIHILKRIPRSHSQFDEAYLQELLANHPELLPVAEIREDAGQLVFIGWEVPVPSGYIDNLYLTTAGYPVVVETKLWRNPEARRQVLVQLLDYIKDVSTKDYAWFEQQWQLSAQQRRGAAQSLFSSLNDASEEGVDESFIIDRVNRALAHGDVIGMVVGDGIETRLQELVDDLCKRTPHLRYALALVELGCFEHEALGENHKIIVPRLVQSVEPVERTYIRIEVAPQIQGQIEVRPVVEAAAAQRRGLRVTLTEEDFLQSVEDAAGRMCRDELQAFYRDLVDTFHLEPEFKGASLMLKVSDPEEDRLGVSVLGLEKSGRVYNTQHIKHQLKRWGVESQMVDQISSDYWASLNAIDERFDRSGISHSAQPRFLPFIDLIAKLPAIKAQVGVVVERVRSAAAAAAAKSGGSKT